MATLSRTTHSLKHFHYIYTVLTPAVTKMEAHIMALSKDEADMLFSKACPDKWTLLDQRELGNAKQWMIRGKRAKTDRSHVYQVGPYFEGSDTATPFTDFINLYQQTFMALPLPALRHQLFKHNGTHIPTAEHVQIIADETGERVEYIQGLIDQEFRARWFENTVQRFGQVHILKLVSKTEFESLMIGRGKDATWKRLSEALPYFGLQRFYRMTVGELLYFYDMNTMYKSSHELYSGAQSINNFPKRYLKQLCELDSRFGELAAQEYNAR